jgi:uncharacterized protein YndB with AHSA1/START domain
MLKIILISLAAVLVVFAVVAAMQPEDFRVVRTATISAPPAVVFAQVNDLHQWQGWSPWAKMDPAAKNSYAGPKTGNGASFSWVGNSKVGEGTMTIVESRPGELVRLNLEFRKPFKGTNTAEFSFKGGDNQTAVTWSMEGKKNFVAKAFGLFMNCDAMVGGQFEEGLANLKAIAEAAARANPADS